MSPHSFIVKYILPFMLAVIAVLSVLLFAFISDNKKLTKMIAKQKEVILLQEAAINKYSENIENIKNQFISLEQSCALKLQAKDDVNLLKTWVPPLPRSPQKINIKSNDNVIPKSKSEFAINSINSYWGRLLKQ